MFGEPKQYQVDVPWDITNTERPSTLYSVWPATAPVLLLSVFPQCFPWPSSSCFLLVIRSHKTEHMSSCENGTHMSGSQRNSLEKDPDAGRDWGQEEKGTIEDEMAGWHHWLDGHELEWTPGVGDGQGGLVCCDSRGHKELDTTERLNWRKLHWWSRCFKHNTF